MQLTFKQLEAFVAVFDQGTFDGAARHLDVAQSAISRQIQELEQWFGFSLFDRSGRSAKPNTVAREVIGQVRHVLLQRDIFDSCLTGGEAVARKLRLGITEFTALSWLPDVVRAVAVEFPRIAIEPVVDASVNLKTQLMAGRLDLVIVPDAFTQESLVRIDLPQVRNSLYGAAEMSVPRPPIALSALRGFNWLIESKNSGSGIILGEWVNSQIGKPATQLNCNSLVAMVGLARSGLGIAFLPDMIALRHVKAGKLRKLDVQPPPPAVPYVALVRADSFSPVIRRILNIIVDTCAGKAVREETDDAQV